MNRRWLPGQSYQQNIQQFQTNVKQQNIVKKHPLVNELSRNDVLKYHEKIMEYHDISDLQSTLPRPPHESWSAFFASFQKHVSRNSPKTGRGASWDCATWVWDLSWESSSGWAMWGKSRTFLLLNLKRSVPKTHQKPYRLICCINPLNLNIHWDPFGMICFPIGGPLVSTCSFTSVEWNVRLCFRNVLFSCHETYVLQLGRSSAWKRVRSKTS